MPKLLENGKFDLALLYGGFVDALEEWAAYQSDKSKDDHATAANLCAHLCFQEGLCAPKTSITQGEAAALRNIITFLEGAKAKRLALSEIKCNQMIETYIKDADQAPGWIYLKKAFSADLTKLIPMVVPTNKGLLATKPSLLQASATLRDAEVVVRSEAKVEAAAGEQNLYDTVVLEDVQPGTTVKEYETAAQKIWDSESHTTGIGAGAGAGGGAVPSNPGGGAGDPLPNDPFDPLKNEGV